MLEATCAMCLVLITGIHVCHMLVKADRFVDSLRFGEVAIVVRLLHLSQHVSFLAKWIISWLLQSVGRIMVICVLVTCYHHLRLVMLPGRCR